jgi:uncharacterized membrane protein YqjE
MPERDLGGGPPPAFSDIAGGLAGDIQDLVRGELALARVELDRKVHDLVMAVVSIAGGALVAFAGLVLLLESGAAVLVFWLPNWAALLIVGAVIILLGGLVARTALASLSLKTLTPERTIASVQKDARMMKDRH